MLTVSIYFIMFDPWAAIYTLTNPLSQWLKFANPACLMCELFSWREYTTLSTSECPSKSFPHQSWVLICMFQLWWFLVVLHCCSLSIYHSLFAVEAKRRNGRNPHISLSSSAVQAPLGICIVTYVGMIPLQKNAWLMGCVHACRDFSIYLLVLPALYF